MLCVRRLTCALAALAFTLLLPADSAAQFRGQLYVSGLTHPVALVQDPSNAAIQYVVEKEGTIRIINNGALVSTPFLDLSGVVSTNEERGLVSLAFPPNYGETGRFFVTFANTDGNAVVARFERSANPLVADPGTRFDLQWSTGLRYLPHPQPFHYAGHLVFGPDGFLYISVGDGGEVNDATNQAQNPSTLYGKFLRIDVNVSDNDNEGFNIPSGNPFANGGGAPEVWSLGFRNPWRYSFDDPRRGGTGALIVGDVGENQIEEIDYEPAGKPGRNYGWRNREGAHDHDTSVDPTVGPLIDPTYEYDHGVGRSVTGGFIYRGSAIPSMVGRYVFGDFVRGRIWSLALTINPSTGEATASDLREHTGEINAGASIRLISSFGVDAAGELYALNYGDGTIVALKRQEGPAPVITVESHSVGAHVRQPFVLSGYALDATASNPGVATMHVWAYPANGAAPRFLGVANYGINRPDVAAIYGPQFAATGFNLSVRGLSNGDWWIVIYAWINATQSFSAAAVIPVFVEPNSLMWIDAPAQNSTVDSPFLIGGWAIDPAALTGTGIDTIHVWAYPMDGGAPTFLGLPQFGDRPDVAAYFGSSQFLKSGYSLIATLPSGSWWVVVYAHSGVTGQFDTAQGVVVNVR